MKRKLIHLGLALSLVTMLIVAGCKKESATPSSADNSAQYDATLLVNDADNSYTEVSVTGGDENTEFSSENEGLPEAYLLVETDMDDAGYKRGNLRRFFMCLKKLTLTDTQVAMIRKDLREYEACKASDIKLHREAYAKLVLRVNRSRQELVDDFKGGKITRAQFDQGMKDLRADFVKSLHDIKASYAKTLKACHEKFIRGIKDILTTAQWRDFVNCYR